MKKTRVNQLLNEIDSMVECLMGHDEKCSYAKNGYVCDCGFDGEKEIVSEKIREVRTELGIWDK